MTTIKTSNYNKSTPKRWRDVGDALLVAIPVITASIEMLPIPQQLRPFLLVGCNLLLVLGKFLTKFAHDPNE